MCCIIDYIHFNLFLIHASFIGYCQLFKHNFNLVTFFTNNKSNISTHSLLNWQKWPYFLSLMFSSRQRGGNTKWEELLFFLQYPLKAALGIGEKIILSYCTEILDKLYYFYLHKIFAIVKKKDMSIFLQKLFIPQGSPRWDFCFQIV